MEQKITLFKYLYDELVKQIKTGRLAYGEYIPSYASLCKLYNVGIRTVRDVVKKLSADGYIRQSSSRLRLEVAYREDNSAGNTTQVKDVLSKRGAVLDLIRSMSNVLPDLYIEAAKLADSDLLQTCRDDIKGIEKMTAKDRWRASSVAQKRILSIFGNALISELYIDTALFAQVPVIDGFDNPYEKISAASKKNMNDLLDMLEFQDNAGIRRMLDARRDRALEALAEYFEALARAYPDLAAKQTDYHWSAEKGRVHQYTAITRDLIEKIGQGVYPDGTYLPTNLKLQAYYGTAPNTLRRAIQALEDTGLVQKKSQRGRYLVTLDAAREKEIHVQSSAVRGDLVTILGALHMTSILCSGIVNAGFDYLPKDAADEFERELNNPARLTMPNYILAKLAESQPLTSLQDIYGQLEHLMQWGYYFAFARCNEAHLRTIKTKTRIAVGYIRTGDKHACSDMLQNIYRYMFHVMQEAFVGFGIAEAGNIKLP